MLVRKQPSALIVTSFRCYALLALTTNYNIKVFDFPFLILCVSQRHLHYRDPLPQCYACNQEVGTCDPPDGSPRACTIPCGHTFCTKCILDRRTDGYHTCPTCYAKHQVVELCIGVQEGQYAERLLTAKELIHLCRKHVLRMGAHGALHNYEPIDVRRVPPMIEPLLASSQLYNGNPTQRTSAQSKSKDLRGMRIPTERDMLPFARLVSEGKIQPNKLRANETCGTYSELRDLVNEINADVLTTAPPGNAAALRQWLLSLYDLIMTGKSECHSFVKASLATGGVLEASCPHGFKLAYMHLFEPESVRHVAALLRSFITFPRVTVYDASCGLVTHMQTAHRDEANRLWKSNRGTFREWREQGPDNLAEVNIPSLSDEAIVRRLQDDNARDYAKQVRDAAGCMRLERHPYHNTDFMVRLVVSDRFHQSLTSFTHRLDSCLQHLIGLCPQLDNLVTSIQESLNKKANRHIKTLSNTDAEHHILYTNLIKTWHNIAVAQALKSKFESELLTGECLIVDDVFGFMRTVCKTCCQPGHRADDCRSNTCE